MADIKQIITGRSVDIYTGTIPLAEGIHTQGAKKVSLYTFGEGVLSAGHQKHVTVKSYLVATAAGHSAADVCMLDGEALKVLAVRYPSDPQYVLARIALRTSWILALPGLLRRLILGWVKIKGLVKIRDASDKQSYWLVIARTTKTLPKGQLLLPENVGIAAFLQWLRQEDVSYVVLRFYEQLPQLHREGGDLDLLVADDDLAKVRIYLETRMEQHAEALTSGTRVGLHTVAAHAGIPYYPPPLARKILTNAVDGPAGSRIPAPEDAFHSFVYHVLYHYKGYATGIPSTLAGRAEYPPENEYGPIIAAMAETRGITIGSTMEELDEYMGRVGWRPKLDTLAKIAKKNAWVHDRFFAGKNDGTTGVTVFILKERVLERGLTDQIVDHVRRQGLIIVRVSVLTAEEKQRARDYVRGGNWVDATGSTSGLLPAAMIIAVDPKCANLQSSYAGEYERARITERKQLLRRTFDRESEPSLVHSADTTQEAWEYIEACFPEEVQTIHDEVEIAVRSSLPARFRRAPLSYVIHTIRFGIRDMVIRRFVR